MRTLSKKNDNLSLACVHGENSGRTFHDDAFPDHIIRYGCPQETPLSCFGIDGSLQGDMTARYYKYDNIRRLCPSEIVVPGVPIIGERSFSGLGLTRAIIPKTVTSIEKYSFSQNSLTDIILPQGLTGISGGAFFENKLTSVTIPEKVEIIGGLKDGSSLRCSFHEGHSRDHTYGAFANNYLTRLTIPGSVKKGSAQCLFKIIL